MRRAQVMVLVGILATSAAAAEQKTDLKLAEVALFSSGVGYFQREATVSGTATADLQFRTEQINDILKSLVLQDLDGGAVDLVTYTPKDPLERTLQSFGVNITGKETLAQLLDSLRGEPVQISGPRQMTGTILGVEKRKVLSGENAVEIDVLNLLSEAGMQQLPLADLEGIKLVNEKVNSELTKALAALASAHDAGKKSVLLKFSGQGERRVRASFLLETPIWKTSYRLVLDQAGKPFLQGWAIVENTTDEDWNNVRLSMVSGRPISFVMDLYTPIYLNRLVEDLERYASLRAPEFAAGFGGFAAGDLAALADGDKDDSREGVPVLARRARPAAAATAGRFEDARARGDLRLSGEGVKAVSEAQEAGELFQYTIQTPVSIARQQSAMLPIVNTEVSGEKLSIFNAQSHPKHPLNGLRLKNSTELNLMQGPVTIFDGNTYAGDAKLPDLKPGEDRLVAYALDLGTEVMTESKPCPVQVVSLSINKGTLIRQHKAVDEKVYKLRNKQDKDKSVLIEQPAGADWKLVEPAEPAERTENTLRFKVNLPAKGTAEQPVRVERVYSESAGLVDFDLKWIQYYITSLGGEVLSPAVRQALEKVVALRTELDGLARERAALEQQLKEAGEEQERIRKNLQVLPQNTDSYKRQLTKLDTLETELEKVREQVAALRKREEQKRAELQNYLANLTVDGTGK